MGNYVGHQVVAGPDAMAHWIHYSFLLFSQLTESIYTAGKSDSLKSVKILPHAIP